MLASCLTCMLLFPGAGYALDPNKHVTQYLHTSWRIQDGSIPKGMHSITQTADGFLWLSASTSEIYRFDGVRFLPRTIAVNGKTISSVTRVYGDRSGGLWVFGVHDLVHLEVGKVVSHFDFDILTDRNVSEDPDGSLWLLRGPGTGMNGPLCRVSDQRVKCFGKAEGQPIPVAASFLRDAGGGFWIGGLKALAHWHDGISEVYSIKALKNITGGTPLMALARTPDGSLWAGALETPPGLARLTEGELKSFVTSSFDGSKIPVTAMLVDRDGNLWVGSVGQGLFRIQGDRVEHYGRAEGLSNDNVDALFEDKEGILWAATPSGIDSFRNPPVTTFSSLEGLGMDLAMGVLASRDGTIWVANGNSLDHIAGETVTSIRQGHGLPGEQATAMLEDSAGNFWVGVDDDLYLLKNGHFQRVPGPHHESLGMVFGLVEDRDGNIWAVCSAKLVRIRDFRVREEFLVPPFPRLREIAADAHDGIWLVSSAGDLLLFRHGALQKHALNVSGTTIDQVVTRADGSVLVPTPDGLRVLRQDKLELMSSKNGLPCDAVISAVEDKDNRWWLFMDCGIVEMPNSELERWWANPQTMVQTRVYDALDGVRTGPQAAFNNAATLSSDGRVWFATGNVVQMVDPLMLSQKAGPAQTYVESLVVDRKRFEATSGLRLPPNPRDLQIDYTSPNLAVPQKVKFRYRLEGYDREWHDAGTRRQAFYTDLPARKYSFQVVACNNDGVCNDTPATLEFFVAPAYYQTNWFRSLCVAAFIGLLWAAYQLRVRQLQREFNTALEARVSERTRIARELHDTLLQGLQALLFQYQAARNLFAGGSERAMQVLDATLDKTEQAIADSRDAIQDIRSDIIAQNALPELLTSAGSELAQSHADQDQPTFGLTVEGERRTLMPIILEETYRIGLELLRNAFRHANARRIEAELRFDGDMLRLRIRDDGKGVDLKLLHANSSGHWGLRGVRERAERIGAKLDAWSEAGAGTEFQLTVPASIAYVDTGDRFPFALFRKVRHYAHRN
jgi:signal transduction histidine kinase/ligand-binding sensor domain-containing protein